MWKWFPYEAHLGVLQNQFRLEKLKLEPKLFLAVSETKRLFRLFSVYIKTVRFGVSIELKQTAYFGIFS